MTSERYTATRGHDDVPDDRIPLLNELDPSAWAYRFSRPTSGGVFEHSPSTSPSGPASRDTHRRQGHSEGSQK